MTNAHLDMDSDVRDLIENLDRNTAYRAICHGDPHAMARLQKNGSATITVGNEGTPQGERQVESLLRFIVDRPLLYAMEDAEADNKMYDHLGEHRILGKHKKKKGKKMRSY